MANIPIIKGRKIEETRRQGRPLARRHGNNRRDVE